MGEKLDVLERFVSSWMPVVIFWSSAFVGTDGKKITV